MGNLVTNLPNYRMYVVYKIPNLRVLDFQKVTKKEKETAKKMFETE
jgi:U2 small nuclear ribonucleoprotein A'